MIKLTAAALLAILVAGCAVAPVARPNPPLRVQVEDAVPFPPAPVAPATREETNAVFSPYRTCLKVAAHQIDDGMSDALTVAQAIRFDCPFEWRQVSATMTKGQSASWVQAFNESSEQFRKDASLTAVLQMRRLTTPVKR